MINALRTAWNKFRRGVSLLNIYLKRRKVRAADEYSEVRGVSPYWSIASQCNCFTFHCSGTSGQGGVTPKKFRSQAKMLVHPFPINHKVEQLGGRKRCREIYIILGNLR